MSILQTQPLVDLYSLVKKDEERGEISKRAVFYLKSLLEPSTNTVNINPHIPNIMCALRFTLAQVLKERRLAWISALLCITERYMPRGHETSKLIEQTRNIRRLHTTYDVVVGFGALRDQEQRRQILKTFINARAQSNKDRNSIEVIVKSDDLRILLALQMASFGRLLSLDTKTLCEELILSHLEHGYIEEALSTLL